jgi:hypothetical protein
MKQTDLLDVFEDGVSREKLRKIEMRKDALMILKVKQKYDVIAKRMELPFSQEKIQFYKLKDGRNLFEIEDFEIEKINYIFELKFQDLDYVRIKVLSLLPELCKLEVKFSNIWLPDLKYEISQNIFFNNLQDLDLSFNNLTDEILYYIRTIKSLKTLNLMGNQITSEIPDLSNLVNLEELNLSSNNIVSFFVNFNNQNFSESEIEKNNNTHVSHFNIMIGGKEYNEGNNNSKNPYLQQLNNTGTEEKNEQENDLNNLANNSSSNIKNMNPELHIEQESIINDFDNTRKVISHINNNNINNINEDNYNKNKRKRDDESLISVKSEKEKFNNITSKNLSMNNSKISMHEKDLNNIHQGNSQGNSNANGENHSNTNSSHFENNNVNINNFNNNDSSINNNEMNLNLNNNNNIKKDNTINSKFIRTKEGKNTENNQEGERERIRDRDRDRDRERDRERVGEGTFISDYQNNETYDEWQKFLKTNLQEFYHKLAVLKNLKKLNLSHNKIHFFDIDPYLIQQINGFAKLNTLDISFNLIEEEISILLVMNIPNLKSIDITCNPITHKKTAYENIEYEIFKTKNILLINSQPYSFKSLIWEPHNKIDFTRRKKYKNYTPIEDNNKEYRVNKDIKIEPVRFFNKKMKNKITSLLERRKKIDEDINKQVPEKEVDILEENMDYTNEDMEIDSNEKSVRSLLAAKKNKENIFLTNTNSQINKLNAMNNRTYEGNEGSENYINFLNLANTCFGKEKHYKDTMPISNAYQKLRLILNNITSSNKNDGNDFSNNYMKPTISRSIFLEEYKPDQQNFKKEMKILQQLKKQNKNNLGDIYESYNEEDKDNFKNSRFSSQKNSIID